MTVTDPMERLIADALNARGFKYVTDFGGQNPTNLDFYLPAHDVHIEVKRFHSDRVAEQMRRAPNVIVAQGEAAVSFLARAIAAGAL